MQYNTGTNLHLTKSDFIWTKRELGTTCDRQYLGGILQIAHVLLDKYNMTNAMSHMQYDKSNMMNAIWQSNINNAMWLMQC